jgi:transposase
MHSITLDQQLYIISQLEDGHSTPYIASITGISISTISRICSKYLPTLPKSTGGHPKKLSPTNTCHAVHLITSGKAETAVDIAKTLQTITNNPISAHTVQRSLKSAGMKAVVKKKKPLLSKRHMKERLDFALAHQYWTLDDWRRVIWSDETKINCLGSDGRKWAWKKTGEGLNERLVQGTVKFGGGSVMVWGCFMWEGVGYATRIEGRMDGELYRSILDEDLQNSIRYYQLDPAKIIFQQDNDPKHTCKKAKEWFENNGMTVLPWPAQSPDLNPIEHLWDYLKRKLGQYATAPSGILELWERIEKEWEDIPASECQKLIESMPRRIEAVIKAKGGYTKY